MFARGPRRSAGIAASPSHPRGVWHDIFSLPVDVWEKVLRAVLVYGFLVAALRVVGKRELGQSNTLDLIVLLLIANTVQNAIIGADNSFTGAVIGGVTLFAVNEALNRAAYRWEWAKRLLEGEPSLLIADGKPVARQLRRASISLPELRSLARRQGFTDLGAVQTAILETNGVVTMFHVDEREVYHPAEPGGLRIGKRRRGRH